MIQVQILPSVSVGVSPSAELGDDWTRAVVSAMDRVRVNLRDTFEVNDIVTPCSIAAMGR